MSSREYCVVESSEKIILSYKPLVVAEAILVYGDQVVAYGSRESIDKAGEVLNAEHVALNKVVAPGFIDAHLHIDSLGFELSTTSLVDVRSRDELIRMVKEMKPNIGEWIVGGRFDHLVFPDKKPPTRRELDNTVSQHPVLLIHRSGHMGVLNTKGLEMVKNVVDEKEVDLDNGWVYEKSLWSIRRRIFESISIEEEKKLFRQAINHLYRNGVTAAGVAGSTLESLEIIKEIDRENSLKTRLYLYIHVDAPNTLPRIAREVIVTALMRGRVRVNGVKILLDGALGPRTAYLSKPYSDDPGNRGLLLYSREELVELVKQVNNYGLQLAIHAIGDAALDLALEAYSVLGEDVSLMRHRIEHASLVRDDQLELIKRLKPVVVVQPHFIITDKWILDRVGVDRAEWIYRFRSLSENTYIGFSTDAPVEPVDPRRTLYAAVSRGILDGLRHGVLTSSEKMSILDALHAYTRGSGYALRDDRLGCLLPGCYADMIAFDRDPLTIHDPREILDLGVEVVELK